MSRRFLLAAMVAAVAMAGCASEPEAAPSPEPSTSQSSPSPSETTETPSPTESEEPYAVPDDIDEAYRRGSNSYVVKSDVQHDIREGLACVSRYWGSFAALPEPPA